ncbi:hypothetical protein M378DRAFT_19504 [Amanita muscaria Koide BX008]|uniref:Uncharacterized protein n=1 Tax=Amanita muscaria (strain Koide BX008) TaxID=946122 RepID=A0A0C2RU83_AMAMK|nr:hypothetical protein M378DRAFT_19546 [Amanita muscaria Koide BX008]KIL53829.1 hypothetical protein M378DRAFT_19504 [Amanita muscaria Koide BX008]
MPAPAALLVAAGITAVASNPVFIHFIYNPIIAPTLEHLAENYTIIAPTLERLAENYIEQRRGRSRSPAAPPVDDRPQSGADDRNDIPLNGMRRRRRRSIAYTSTSYENGDGDEESGLLMVQTADENVGADMTLGRRPVAAVPVVDNTILEESSLLFGVQGSTTARELNVNENISSTATPPRRPDSVDNNNNCRFGSKRRTPLVLVQDKKLRPQPTVAISGLSLPVNAGEKIKFNGWVRS